MTDALEYKFRLISIQYLILELKELCLETFYFLIKVLFETICDVELLVEWAFEFFGLIFFFLFVIFFVCAFIKKRDPTKIN